MIEREPSRADSANGRRLCRSGLRWQAEFPYHWDADELVTRRALLHFAVSTSGALFAGTAVLTLVGLLRQRQTSGPQPIAAANEVLEGQAFYFSYPRPDDQAMLLHLPGGRFVAYGQRCTHLSCAAYYEPHNSRVFCPCHEGIFNPETGDPVAGPPPRRLEQIALQQQDGMIYAVGRQP